jgi:hypothetical protein
MLNKDNQENKVDLVKMNYFVEKMEGVVVIGVVETTSPNFHSVDRVLLLQSVVVDGIENSNEDLAHVVDELISMNED